MKFRKGILCCFLGLTMSGIGVCQDFTALEKDLQEAGEYLAQAQKINQETKEKRKMSLIGALKVPYRKEMSEVEKRCHGIRNKLEGAVNVRKILAGRITSALSGTPRIESQFAEDIGTVEATVLPQVLYRNAAMTLKDIEENRDLFLPPLIRFPEKKWKDYKKALANPASPKQEGTAAGPSGTRPPAAVASLDKTVFYRILSSPWAQRFYIDSELAAARKRISQFQAASSPADLYALGNAHLLEAFYKRLDESLDGYRKAQERIQIITDPPRAIEFMDFAAKVSKVQVMTELPELNIDNLHLLKDSAQGYIQMAKIPLPKDSGEIEDSTRMDSKLEEQIKQERTRLFSEYRQLVEPAFHFNILPVPDEAVSAVEKAINLEPNNPHYHLRLGNLYRMRAFSALLAHLRQANEHSINAYFSGGWKYYAKDKKAEIELAETSAYLGKALEQYRLVLKLSPQLGERALGVFYLSQISLDPELAQEALAHLRQAGDQEESLLALEYAGYLIGRAQLEQEHLDFPKSLKDIAASTLATYQKFPANSGLKPIAMTLLSEQLLMEVFGNVVERAERAFKKNYEAWIKMLDQGKSLEPENPYAYLLQGFFTYRMGMAMTVGDAFSILKDSFGMMAGTLVNASNVLDESVKEGAELDYSDHRRFDRKHAEAYKNLENYVDKKSKMLDIYYKEKFGTGADIFIKRYKEEDFLSAVDIYNQAIAKTPDLALNHYYLGRTYSILSAFYRVHKDAAKSEKYGKLAKDAFTQFATLSQQGSR